MLDLRFHALEPPISLAELAALTGSVLAGGADADRPIRRVAPLGEAEAGDVAFCADRRFLAALKETRASACFLFEAMAGEAPSSCVTLLTRAPGYAYAAAASRLVRERVLDPGAPNLDPSARLESDVVVGSGAIVGAGAAIGRGSRILPGALIGPGVAIGRDCVIGAGAKIGFALIGDRVHVHSGAVIGDPGFGAAAGPGGLIGMPQLGRVILQDDVRIGANSCVDRGAWADTIIGERTRIDNLVHIGHNVIVGRDCAMAAFTGISGSCVIGDGCMFGGRAGVVDHITIGDGARIGADAAIMKNVPAGESWAGSPARPVKTWLRQTAWIARASKRGGKAEGA